MPISREDRNAPVRKMIEQANEENTTPPTSQVRFDRSPHPYHRRQLSPSGSITRSGKTLASHHLQTTTAFPNEQRHSEQGLADASSQKPSKPATSSDSGTEADDESGGVLRGLPAPPIKRKGSSPLLTPRNTDDGRRKLYLEYSARHEGNRSAPGLTDEEERRIRNKLNYRRRVEFLRRLVEITLLGGVGFIACGKRHEEVLHLLGRGMLSSYQHQCAILTGIFRACQLLLYRFWHLPSIPFTTSIPTQRQLHAELAFPPNPGFLRPSAVPLPDSSSNLCSSFFDAFQSENRACKLYIEYSCDSMSNHTL